MRTILFYICSVENNTCTMGKPVKTIQSFEEGLREGSKNWAIIILANAYSDSRAVQFVLDNFHEMDVVSDDVDFYLPGYGINKVSSSGGVEDKLEGLNRFLANEYPDFRDAVSTVSVPKQSKGNRNNYSTHRTPVLGFCIVDKFDIPTRRYENDTVQSRYCKVIDSPRLGPVFFNKAEYADFVMEFTRRKKGFVYLGKCQMLLVPVSDGTPAYDRTVEYDLDAVIDCPYGPSLDNFLHGVFHIIREASNRYRGIRTVLERLKDRRSWALQEIERLYFEATRYRERYDEDEQTMNDVIKDMERCLGWDLWNDYYFISYSSQNVTKAETLKKTMQNRGLRVWMAPDEIPQGREYALVVPTALKLARNFVLLLTPDSAKSQWVKRELDIAISNEANTKVRVLLADGFSIRDIRADNELMFYLNRVQVKYDYHDIVRDESVFERFITE